MAVVELLMPKMGESIIEATIIGWTKQVGDQIEVDETVLEVATDKVDSEVPSPVAGILKQILHDKDAVVAVGSPLALIETDAAAASTDAPTAAQEESSQVNVPAPSKAAKAKVQEAVQAAPVVPKEVEVPEAPYPASTPSVPSRATSLTPQSVTQAIPSNANGKFYSPLVRNIARAEGISLNELSQITGTGPEGRITKIDLINYIDQKKLGLVRYQTITAPPAAPAPVAPQVFAPSSVPTASEPEKNVASSSSSPATSAVPTVTGGDEIIELSRMRRVIAGHMRNSLDTSAHVTTFIEADATRLVSWRNKIKNEYHRKYGEKITFSPLFTECVIKALREHPQINATLDGDHLIVKKDINIGIATAMKNGNLIVPVIKRANDLNLHGLTRQLNELTSRARDNKLAVEEMSGGTFTISNLGTFGNIMGTPIINQPQLAIVALGAIKKKPVIQETPEGDIIAIRHMMFLSLAFDHRVIDGYQGGTFLNSIAKHIENFDTNRTI